MSGLLRVGELQAYRATANASFGSGESRSTVSSITMSKSWPHLGQMIC
jgi:hypothetical protein